MNLMLSDVVDRENYSMIHALMFAFDDYTFKVHWVVWISHFQQYLFSTITITCMGEFVAYEFAYYPSKFKTCTLYITISRNRVWKVILL